jgi:hypothetical protein
VSIVQGSSSSQVVVRRGTATPLGHENETEKDADHNVDGLNDHVSQANCSIMQISSPVGVVERSATHEMGHSLGLQHTGGLDTRHRPGGPAVGYYESAGDGLAPLMNGNCSVAAAASYPTLDDWSALVSSRTAMVTADAGFESDSIRGDAWRGTFTVETATPQAGSRYISMVPQQQVGQRVRVDGSPTDTFTVRANFKTNSSSPTSFKLFGKRTYRSAPGYPCGQAGYFIDQSGGYWTQLYFGNAFDPDGASTWQSFSSGAISWPTYNPSSYEIELDVFNGAPAASGQLLLVDNFRVEQ